MDLGFGGEVAEFCHQYRRGYPPAVLDLLAGAFGLTSADIVIDLGCGTGQLALPIAARVRAVAAVDPEPAMLARGRRAAAERGIANVTWILGADTDTPALAALLGGQQAGAVTIGQALHWMNDRDLFPALLPLLRPGGGIAVITNGTPLWQQDTAWSRALRAFLERWLDADLTSACGTDQASQQRYRDHLAAAGLAVTSASVEYTAEFGLDYLVGSLLSALPLQRLPLTLCGFRPPSARSIRRMVHGEAQIAAAACS